MHLGTLDVSLFRNLSSGKGVIRPGDKSAGNRIKKEFLILSHPLTDIEIQRFQNKSKFKGAYSRNNILKIMNDEAYLVNLDKHTLA